MIGLFTLIYSVYREVNTALVVSNFDKSDIKTAAVYAAKYFGVGVTKVVHDPKINQVLLNLVEKAS